MTYTRNSNRGLLRIVDVFKPSSPAVAMAGALHNGAVIAVKYVHALT